MESVLAIGALVASFGWKLYTDTQRSRHLRVGILIGCLLCVISGTAGVLMFGSFEDKNKIISNILPFTLVGAGLAVGGILIYTTNLIDHDFLRSYGPIRKAFFWYRNVTGLLTAGLMGLLIASLLVTMAVTGKVSEQENAFELKKAELEKKMASAELTEPAPRSVATAHHHHRHHHN